MIRFTANSKTNISKKKKNASGLIRSNITTATQRTTNGPLNNWLTFIIIRKKQQQQQWQPAPLAPTRAQPTPPAPPADSINYRQWKIHNGQQQQHLCSWVSRRTRRQTSRPRPANISAFAFARPLPVCLFNYHLSLPSDLNYHTLPTPPPSPAATSAVVVLSCLL